MNLRHLLFAEQLRKMEEDNIPTFLFAKNPVPASIYRRSNEYDFENDRKNHAERREELIEEKV